MYTNSLKIGGVSDMRRWNSLTGGLLFAFFVALLMTVPRSQGATTTIYVSQSGGTFSGGTACNGQTAISVATFNSTTLTAGETVYLCGTITSEVAPKNGGAAGNPVLLQWDTGASVQSCNLGGAVSVSGLSYLTFDLGGNSTAVECPNNGVGLSASIDGTSAFASGTYSGGNTSWNGWSNIEIRNGTIGPVFQYSGTGSVGFDSICISGGEGANNTYLHNVTLTGCAEGMEIDPTGTSTDQFSYITSGASVGRVLNYANGASSNFTSTGSFHNSDVNFTSVWVVPGDYEHYEALHIYNTGNSGSQDKIVFQIYDNYWHGSSPSTNNAGSTALIFTGEGGSSCSASSTNTVTAFNNLIVDSGNSGTGFSQGTGGYFYMQDCEQTFNVYNNTIVMNGTSNPCYRFLETGGTTPLVWNVKNNVCIGGGGASYGAYWDAKTSTMNFSNNDYYNIGSGGWQIGNNTYTFAQWQSQISGDTSSITTNPNLSASYLVQNTSSPVYQTGTNLTSLGNSLLDVGAPQTFGQSGACGTGCVARSSSAAWDMGAYPFGGSTATQAPNPPTGLTATVQ